VGASKSVKRSGEAALRAIKRAYERKQLAELDRLSGGNQERIRALYGAVTSSRDEAPVRPLKEGRR
jgi:hypothetical protein